MEQMGGAGGMPGMGDDDDEGDEEEEGEESVPAADKGKGKATVSFPETSAISCDARARADELYRRTSSRCRDPKSRRDVLA